MMEKKEIRKVIKHAYDRAIVYGRTMHVYAGENRQEICKLRVSRDKDTGKTTYLTIVFDKCWVSFRIDDDGPSRKELLTMLSDMAYYYQK